MEKRNKRKYFLILSVILSALLLAITVLTISLIRTSYVDHMIGLLGAASEAQVLSKESLDAVLSSGGSAKYYGQGLQVLEQYGYGKSGINLLNAQVVSGCWSFALSMILLLIAIVVGLLCISRQQNRFLSKVVRWIKHLDNEEYEQEAIAAGSAATNNLVYALQEHKQMDDREKQCLEMEKQKTISFVEDISHQLKTPLTIMRMHIEKINYSQNYSKESINKAIHQVDKMVLLISMLMKIGMLNSGKTKMEILPHNIWVLAEEIDQEFLTVSEVREVEIHSEVLGNTAFFYDDYWLKECIENLVKNCIEYSEPGGVVSIIYQGGGSGLYIYVKDKGRGIEDQNVEQIFERFTSSYRQNDSSSGLGLAIARQVVDAHFGKISVENNPDAGVTFTIYLPTIRGREVYSTEEEIKDDGNFKPV